VQMPPDQPPNAGSKQILHWSRGFLAAFSAKFSLTPAEIELAEPACAIEHGRYEITLVPRAGGEPVRDTGKYLTIYRRMDGGGWLMAYDIWNSNGPSPA
jgi:ketosteroid isomerase-like protein